MHHFINLLLYGALILLVWQQVSRLV